jgi:predicted ribosomally synthesized peptide with nif11-like leader
MQTMSQEQRQGFREPVAADPELQQRLSAADSDPEALAREAGFDGEQSDGDDPLSDEALEDVSGGTQGQCGSCWA